MLKALVKFIAFPFIAMFLYLFNMVLAVVLLIGCIYLSARFSIDFLGEVPTGRDMTGAIPFIGMFIGGGLAIGVCGFFMFGFAIPYALDYILSLAEDVAPQYKPVAKRVEGYIDSAKNYLDER